MPENTDSTDPPTDTAVEIENVRVVVRVRPIDKIERDVNSENVVKVDKINRSVVVRKPNANPGEPPKIYYFDNVFGEDSSQFSNMETPNLHPCKAVIEALSAKLAIQKQVIAQLSRQLREITDKCDSLKQSVFEAHNQSQAPVPIPPATLFTPIEKPTSVLQKVKKRFNLSLNRPIESSSAIVKPTKRDVDSQVNEHASKPLQQQSPIVSFPGPSPVSFLPLSTSTPTKSANAPGNSYPSKRLSFRNLSLQNEDDSLRLMPIVIS